MPGIYIHIPFCRKKCPYCSFVSQEVEGAPVDAYMEALTAEMDACAGLPEAAGLDFASIYVGGGTPSLLSPDAVHLLVSRVMSFFGRKKRELEITIEANPESSDPFRLEDFRGAGVNRLSLGFQSLDKKGVARLGRIHEVRDSIDAFESARRAGFENIGIDLIYGWPGQDLKGWAKELDVAASLRPEHVSCYELTIEQGTPFASICEDGGMGVPDEDTVLRLADMAEEILGANGYEHYEISNFALPGFRSRHNVNYWRNGSYLGLGCSAVSYLSSVRRKNTSDLSVYIDAFGGRGIPCAEEERLDHEAQFRETVILGLRMMDGVSRSEMLSRFSIDPIEYYRDNITYYINEGLIDLTGDVFSLTKRGRRIANYVMSAFV